MKHLFGTDGIRAVAGEYPLDPPTVAAVGASLVRSRVMRCKVWRFEPAYRAFAQRSISPMTMSMLALMAMTSESKCPSTIFGIAARFTKDGGRMRQRTGLAVPSDTI